MRDVNIDNKTSRAIFIFRDINYGTSRIIEVSLLGVIVKPRPRVGQAFENRMTIFAARVICTVVVRTRPARG